MKKRLIAFIPYIIILTAILAIIAPKYFTKAEATPEITAKLCDTSEYRDGTELTEEGATVSGWQYGTNKYLQIMPTVPNDGNKYKVVISMPVQFYAAINEAPSFSAFETPTFTKNSSFKTNKTGTYNVNAHSGTFEYMMDENATSGTIQLAIAYDEVLWANIANSSLTPQGVNPITVKLIKIDSNDVETIVKTICIKEATAGTARSFVQTIYVNSSSTVATLKFNENAKIMLNYREGNQSSYDFYFKKMNVSIKLPSYKDSENVLHYLTPDISTITLSSFKTTPDYTVDTSELEDGIIKITVNDAYFTNSTNFSITTSLPDELKTLTGNIPFSNGKATIIAETINGKDDVLFFNKTMTDGSITYTTILEEKVSAPTINATPNIQGKPADVVSRLGGMQLRNTGKGDSGPKTIFYTFDTGNTGKIKVTTINIVEDVTQEYIDIEYSLIDDNGNNVYFDDDGNIVSQENSTRDTWHYSLQNSYCKAKAVNNMRKFLTRKNLEGDHKNYYFKTIKYTIEGIPAGISLYGVSGSSGTTSGGNFFGYTSSTASARDVIISAIKIIDVNGLVPDINVTSKTTITAGEQTSYYLGTATMNETNIEAGSSVTLNGSITLTDYPYGNSSWLRKIVIGAVLPNGVTISGSEAISAQYNKSKVRIEEFDVLAPIDLGDGTSLWKIKFPEEECISTYEETALGETTNGKTMNFSIKLDTDITMNTTVLSTHDMIFVAGIGQTNSANGSYNWARAIDTYDLNENGSTTDYITRIKDKNDQTCQITPKSATIDVSDNISIISNGNILPVGDNNIYSNNDTVTYNAEIGCSNGGRIDDFEYYIPIPKKTALNDSFLISGDSFKSFDFELKSEATLSGTDVFSFEYCFETGLNYSLAKNVTNWYTADQINSDETLKWKDVTMIKVTMSHGIINNGDSSKISVEMKYGGENYLEEAGMTNKWSSGGTYNYWNNGRIVAGDMAANGVQVMLNCKIDLDEITLTAAKDRTPLDHENVNEVIVNTGLPEFINEQTFTIDNIETYNATLQTKNYIQNNLDMSSVLANQTFAITTKLNNNTEHDLTKNTILGKNNANTAPTFEYELYNANSLSDNLQTRYVIVTLKSDNGVSITQKININIEIAGITEITPAIVAGKSFMAISDTQDTITITENSSFTAQFEAEYLPSSYTNQKIVFSESLPIGTNIILTNKREDENQTYWYYTVSQNNTSEINLNQFNKMGTSSGNNFSKLNNNNNVKEQFLIAVDFEKCSNYLTRSTHTIKLNFTGNGVEDFNSTNLNFITTAKRGFTLTTSTPRTDFDKSFSINYTLGEINGVETKYLGKKMTLVLTAPNTLPIDSCVTVDSNKYYMNSNRKFIIPLNNVQTGSANVEMMISSDMLPKTENDYNMSAELWISSTANGLEPMMGEKVAEKTIIISSRNIPQPALKVTNMENRLILLEDVQKLNKITYDYKLVNGCSATIEVQKKIGNGYQKMTNVLAQVNGNTSHNMGVFALNPSNGTNVINMSLAMATEKGTYRVVFKISDENSNVLLEIPYNFLVID